MARSMKVLCFFFFFQAEDGIRDFHVTGVQTCALPISGCSTRQIVPCTFSNLPRRRSRNTSSMTNFESGNLAATETNAFTSAGPRGFARMRSYFCRASDVTAGMSPRLGSSCTRRPFTPKSLTARRNPWYATFRKSCGSDSTTSATIATRSCRELPELLRASRAEPPAPAWRTPPPTRRSCASSIGDSSDDCREQLGQAGCGSLAARHHLFVRGPFAGDARRRVRDQGEREHLSAECVRGDRLRDRGHPNEIGAEGPQHADLGRRLVGRTGPVRG